jgi:hypothetical protein
MVLAQVTMWQCQVRPVHLNASGRIETAAGYK